MSPSGVPAVAVASKRYLPVLTHTRLALCSIAETEVERNHHVAAVMAWTAPMHSESSPLRFSFDYAPTAWWLAEALDSSDAAMTASTGDCGQVRVGNPRHTLHRYGFRGGRWKFEPGAAAALGIARGAVHCCGEFRKTGMRVECPRVQLMLTLVAVFERLGIKCQPHEGIPRIHVAGGQVGAVLARLGLEEPAALYDAVRGADRGAKESL